MAGNANSGRRGAPRDEQGRMTGAEPFEADASDPAPRDDINTLEGNAKALEWLWRQVVEGRMAVTDAEKASTILAKAAGLIGRRHTMRELEEMRALVKEYKNAKAEIMAARERRRYSAEGATMSRGRRVAAPDGEPQ